MKIVADENIPYVNEFFDRFGEVKTLPGRTMQAAEVNDADILLVRSVTPVNESLLQGSNIKFVGTCTIGTDHLDKAYLQENNIAFASAPGCNAGGVVQYDLTALAELDPNWQQRKIGVIGHGNVGGRLCRALISAGVDVCAYDPFLSARDIPYLTDLNTVLNTDAICMHAPYTTDGPFPTRHMISTDQLKKIKPGTILLNAGRGGAIDNLALLNHLHQNPNIKVVLDVWEGEPEVNTDLLKRVDIATPHIAGYSFEGKVIGSAMIFNALAEFLGFDVEQYRRDGQQLLVNILGKPEHIAAASVNEAISATYKIYDDDARMREAILQAAPDQQSQAFDKLRKNYPQRREFGHFKLTDANKDSASLLSGVGFVVNA